MAQTSYDRWVTRVVDGSSHCQEADRDGFGRTVTVREYTGLNSNNTCAVNATTRYGYDLRDRLTSVTDSTGNGLQPSITYDALGRKTALSDPDLGPWSYRYDVRGNLTRQVDARGTALLFAYDGESRLTSKGPPNERISASEITRLRDAINAQRQALGYAAFSWTDPTLSASTRVRDDHFIELRDALRGIAGRANLQHAAGDPARTRTVRASDIADLRRWVYGDETSGQQLTSLASLYYYPAGFARRARIMPLLVAARGRASTTTVLNL